MPDKLNNELSTEPYKGVRDFYPEDKAVQNYIFKVWRKTAELYGFQEYDASILEPTEIYQTKSGEELISEQTYTFIDRGGRSVTLRPEMTPTVARMVAAKKRDLANPLRLFSIPNLFRYERPQRGRLREHWQLNVDIFGVDSNEAEVELITIADHIMRNFGLASAEYTIRISSRKLLNAIFSEWYELDEDKSKKLQKLIDKKSKISAEEFGEKANGIVGEAFKFLTLSPDDETYEEAIAMPMIRKAKEELDDVIEKLKFAGINNVIYDPELIRGFDYYSGIIFEIFDNHKDNKRSLFGGGRYDGLINIFGEENVPACGFGMGDVTILDVLETYNLIPEVIKDSKTRIYICPINESDILYAKDLAKYFRENNLNTAIHSIPKKLGDQIKQAEKQNIQWVVILGAEEIKNRIYTLKNIRTGEELKLNKEEIVSTLKI
jgi:histidyl-tRNA synthetase